MIRASLLGAGLCLLGIVGGCSTKSGNTFDNEVRFLKSHTDVVVLSDSSGQAKVAVAPALQGRVMTSTSNGDSGPSFGWVNHQYFTDVAAGKTNPHMGPYGGEDRFWIGPEGGQFGLFFAKGASFDLEHWFTPKFIDVEPFQTIEKSANSASFRRTISFNNYSGTPFQIQIDRTVRLINTDDVWKDLSLAPSAGVNVVAFETDNRITNTGSADWNKDTGLLSIWILGMFNASPKSTIVVPIKSGDESTLGKPVNDDYFGKVPADRLKVIDGTVYFKADANYRSKIGIPPARSKSILGSYDPVRQVLTLVQYDLDPSARDYVNSAWKIQDNPFSGDVVNSYNDGPPAPGKPQLGKFYELETSSPALALAKGQTGTHTHRTFHFKGDPKTLDAIAYSALGVHLDQITAAFADGQ